MIGSGTSLQTHLFEDRVMKMSHVRVGPGFAVGPRSVVLYDAELEAGAVLEPLSLAMKGELLPANTRCAGYRGNWLNEAKGVFRGELCGTALLSRFELTNGSGEPFNIHFTIPSLIYFHESSCTCPAGTGAAWSAKIRLSTIAGVMRRMRASGRRMTRCERTGRTIFLTSSGNTKLRPAMAAIACAVRYSASEARAAA